MPVTITSSGIEKPKFLNVLAVPSPPLPAEYVRYTPVVFAVDRSCPPVRATCPFVIGSPGNRAALLMYPLHPRRLRERCCVIGRIVRHSLNLVVKLGYGSGQRKLSWNDGRVTVLNPTSSPMSTGSQSLSDVRLPTPSSSPLYNTPPHTGSSSVALVPVRVEMYFQ